MSDINKNKSAETAEDKKDPVAPEGKAVPENEKKSATDKATDLSKENWEKSKLPWNASPQGRLAIRLFSRGVMGAAFYTAGGMLNRKWMHDPTVRNGVYEEGFRGGKYDSTKPFCEQDNPLKFIAKLIDTVVGKPIEVAVHNVTGSEELAKRAIRFRPTKFKDMEQSAYLREFAAGGSPHVYRGRSLGNEVVAVTFDFFCASIGDAFGRDIAAWVDPNVKKSWIKNGHIDVPEAVKSLTKTGWRYVTYNGGEDWAVAVPYVYFMKGQRSFIEKMSPGFINDFDRNLNGGSFKIVPNKLVGNQGGKGYHIVGNYNTEGLFDLQNRFVVYNMGTLAYRELYDYVGRKMDGKHAVLYGSPEKDTSKETLGEKAGNVAKWLMRSVVKAGIYMTPATPFFWITRTPQTNYRGLFINPKTGETLSYEDPKHKAAFEAGDVHYRHYKNVYANDIPGKYTDGINKSTGFSRDTEVYWAKYEPHPNKFIDEQFTVAKGQWLPGRQYNPISHDFPFDPYADRQFGMHQKPLNAIGKANYNIARAADDFLGKTNEKLMQYPNMNRNVKAIFSLRPHEPLSRFAHSFVNASMSYTPYMYAKAECANLWDDGKMDMATERLIDGATSLNWGEFKAGAGEVWRSILHKPLKDPAREAEAQHRVELDTSPPAAVNLNGGYDSWKEGQRTNANWRERVIQGRPEDQPEIGANRPKSYAEQEEMREALKHMVPPTNSVN